MTKKVVVIGAGFGGLSCAIGLASRGFDVTVLERQPTIGGKLQRITAEGYSFDRGPSTITMPEAFRSVFTAAGARMEDYCELYELEPRTRNIFADGSVVDLSRDTGRMKEQIAAYSSHDAMQYDAFMTESAALYRQADEQFMHKLLVTPRDRLSLPMLRGLLRVRPLVKLQTLLQRYFKHPHTLAMFGRYATYVGSSPYQSPSIFAMLGHVEANMGIYGVRGGTYRLADGLRQLAEERGVRIQLNTDVHQIVVQSGRVEGVDSNHGFFGAELVIANGDVLTVNRNLLSPALRPSMSDQVIDAYEPSLSGFVTLAGVRRQYDQLLHHTVFFPEQYEPEFKDIFDRKTAPADPTIYICWSGATEKGMAPEGASNLFILANAPYLSDEWDWTQKQDSYRNTILTNLEKRGITGLRHAEVLMNYTPQDIARDTLAHRGSIYGISSNSAKQTFFRPGNRSKDVRGLWYVGGTTHPGGGTPLVTLSGQLVAEYIAGSSW
ncbi:phytoene desaturase family protein [Paenibacillus sp. JX-17]|uniref:4,4'-diaponeurosporene oxygenase n=1 Tax=Paenibacillus lacisoli TaxID=3064525 RepID=A0ABT9CB60_9BACL|nr:phytoene desaturase family protein [Paenibacillus sp. JX-17]MDO7906500.1 phytoene desaturase family protein [Paenibacillus sp. JX-17]